MIRNTVVEFRTQKSRGWTKRNGKQLSSARYWDLCVEGSTWTIIRRVAAIMEAFTRTVFPSIPLYTVDLQFFQRFEYRGSWKDEAFVSHAVLHWRTRQVAYDQRAALSNRIREHQVIFLPLWMGRFSWC